MEGQAFLRSFDSATPSPSPVGKIEKIEKRGNLLTETEEGGGRGAESYDSKKAWPCINHSILSGFRHCHLLVLYFYGKTVEQFVPPSPCRYIQKHFCVSFAIRIQNNSNLLQLNPQHHVHIKCSPVRRCSYFFSWESDFKEISYELK
jgi:hypothetical protein